MSSDTISSLTVTRQVVLGTNLMHTMFKREEHNSERLKTSHEPRQLALNLRPAIGKAAQVSLVSLLGRVGVVSIVSITMQIM